MILQVKSSTKLQKYTLYFNKCCFKLREFALKVPRYLSNYLLFFVSDTLWKPHGNTFLITKTNICRIHLLHAWISDLVRFLPQCEKGFVRFFGLYFCFADNLDFLTLPRCHLSKLGLLRNNCQIITQVGVHERGRIVFICRKIQVLLHSIEFKFVMWVDFFFKTVNLIFNMDNWTCLEVKLKLMQSPSGRQCKIACLQVKCGISHWHMFMAKAAYVSSPTKTFIKKSNKY